MIINPYLVVPGTPPYDPDAQAFITAAGLTTPTQQNAINELVLNLKNANIWTKFNAVYPMVTDKATQVDMASQMKFNLKNPLDTNAAFRITWFGGWTYSSNGALPTGTGYANTNLNSSTVLTLNSTHLSYYSRTTSAVSSAFEMGNVITSNSFGLSCGFGNVAYSDQYNFNTARISQANTDARGFYISTRTTSAIHKLFKNGSQFGTTNTGASGTFNNLVIYIGALNNNGTASTNSVKECAFASIGSGLTDLEAQVFNQIVEGYQFALGRNINPSQSFYYNRNYNNETNAYLFSTQITNTTEQAALDAFVTSMKGYGIWSKMKAVYPIMGTTATQQKFNLVNAQDTNDAYRITFAGGWTHSSTGMTGNGINTSANPNLIPSSVLTTNNTHISYYIGTDTAAGNKIEMGVGVGGTLVPIMLLSAKYTGNLSYSCAYNLSTNQITAANADARGFYVGSRTTSTSHKLYKDGSVLATDTNANSNTLPTQGIIIGALNSNGSIVQYTDRQYRFISIGDGLNDTEVSNFRTAVQALQTALGRQI